MLSNYVEQVHEKIFEICDSELEKLGCSSTNSSYIRNLSDEELACRIECPYDLDCLECFDCFSCKLTWLREERKK